MTSADRSSAEPQSHVSVRGPRSFLPRFGLRSLLLFAIVFSLFFGWVGRNIHRTRQEDAAIETLRRAGTSLAIVGGDSFVSADEEDNELTVRDDGTTFLHRAIGRTYRPRIQRIVLDHRTAPEPTIRAAIDGLRHLPEIEQIALWGTFFDDATCESLSRCSGLQELSLRNTSVSDRGLSRLESLPNLRTLTLSDPPATEALAALPRLRRLRTLTLFNLVVDREAIAGIATLPELESLELMLVHANEEGAFRPLGAATNLRSLIILSSSMSDDDLPSLRELRDLERLEVRVQTDSGLAHFAGLSKLRRLDLFGGVTSEAVRRFSKEHPEILIGVRENPVKAPVRYQSGVALDDHAVNEMIEEATEVDIVNEMIEEATCVD